MRAARVSVGLTVAALTAAALPAMAATSTTATPAAGESTSQLTLLSVGAVGNKVQALQAALTTTDLTSPASASIALTPLLKDGAAVVPPVTVTDGSDGQRSVDSHQQSIAGVLTVSSPAAALTAQRTATGAVAKLAANGQNLLSVLGLPVGGSVSIDDLSQVAGGDASAGKHLVVSGLSLPSIADLLGGLGLDLSKLPLDSLLALVNQLGLSTAALDSAVAAVNTQIDTLQGQIDTVTAQIASQTATLNSDTAQLQQLQDAVTAAQQQVDAAIAATGLPITCSTIPSVPPVGVDLTAVTSACNTLTAAQTALSSSTLQSTITTLQSQIDALQAQLADLTNQLKNVAGPLITQVLGVLDGAPLVSLAKLDVSTLASAGTKHVADVTGTVTGLKVANTDVLQKVTGSSSLDLVKLAGSTLTGVQSTVSGLLGQLSTVLSSVPQLPDLKVPAPTVKVLQKSTSLDPIGGLQAATASVTALQIDWPGLQIPDAVALAGVANLLPRSQQSHATLVGQPLSLTIGSLGDVAKARPATTAPQGTPQTPSTPTSTPQLPMTGLAGWLPVTALLLVGTALGIRRSRRSA